MAHLRSPAGVSSKTKRRYAPRTGSLRRELGGFFQVLPKGRDATLADITKGFLLEYRRTRTRAQGGVRRMEREGQQLAVATLNRDLRAERQQRFRDAAKREGFHLPWGLGNPARGRRKMPPFLPHDTKTRSGRVRYGSCSAHWGL